MNIIKYFLVLIFFHPNLLIGQGKTYTKQEVKEDLTFLQYLLDERHPNIGIYATKEELNAFFDHISISDSLSELEVYTILASTNKIIQDGHTLFYPNQNLLKRNNDSGFFLPIQPFWDGKKLYLTKNYSQLKELNLACEIVSINGLLSKDLIESMLNKMMRDGNNFQYPIWVLNSYFFEYYSYFFGCNKNYQLVVKEEDKDKLIELEGIPKSELFQRINEQKKIPEKGISFEILEANSTAILNIKDWHNDVLRKYYHQKFKPEIKNIIQQIEHSNIENLIIDVRNNQGGDLTNSKFLLSYLLNEPFVIVEKYYKNKKGKMIESRGPQMGIHKPLPVTFKGKVYVLINGGSFSNSSIFCSVLKKHKRAIFIGEETGGSEFLICGITKTFQLPNSNVTIELPKLKFLIKDYKHKELHGITPDFPKKPTVESLINGKDIILEYAIKLINENSSQFNK